MSDSSPRDSLSNADIGYSNGIESPASCADQAALTRSDQNRSCPTWDLTSIKQSRKIANQGAYAASRAQRTCIGLNKGCHMMNGVVEYGKLESKYLYGRIKAENIATRGEHVLRLDVMSSSVPDQALEKASMPKEVHSRIRVEQNRLRLRPMFTYPSQGQEIFHQKLTAVGHGRGCGSRHLQKLGAFAGSGGGVGIGICIVRPVTWILHQKPSPRGVGIIVDCHAA